MSAQLPKAEPPLCLIEGCLLLRDHAGEHSRAPEDVFGFLQDKDKDKLSKAGYATPRGGAKGAYQNHVYRNGRVIIPYERFAGIPDLSIYKDGYVVRVQPEQCFAEKGKLKPEFRKGGPVVIGKNAFVLYRSHESYKALPPLKGWRVRTLIDEEGNEVLVRRKGANDIGHYVLRLPKIGGGKKISKHERIEGPPQGIFAPEYADGETDFLCRVSLAWQIVHTADSPYVTAQAARLKGILEHIGLESYNWYNAKGIMNKTFTTCPLCLRPIYYKELHEMLTLEDESGLLNAGVQVAGLTRSTLVNLFHFHPLVYESLEHIPQHVAWGHAICNTKLGQRRCYTVKELVDMNSKVGIVRGEKIETIGWISGDHEMIRSPLGAVWVQITKDTDLSRFGFLAQ